MPAVVITGNSNLTSFDFKTVFDLANGQIRIDLSPTQWTGGGNNNVGAARIRLVAPNGQVIKDGTTNDFLPPMDQILGFDIPKIAGVYVWGIYQVEVTLIDGPNTYLNKKTFYLCSPTADLKRNTGVAQFQLEPDCDTGVMHIYGGDGYGYFNKTASSWVKNITFYFPQQSNQAHIPFIVTTPFEVQLYTGTSTVKGASVGTYNFDDNFSVQVKFVGEESRDVRCNRGYCHLWCALESLRAAISNTDTNNIEYEQLSARYTMAIQLIAHMEFGLNCGKNIDHLIKEAEQILGIENCCQDCLEEELGVKVGDSNVTPSTSSTTTAAPTTSTTQAPTTSTTTSGGSTTTNTTTAAPTTSTTTAAPTTSTTTAGPTTSTTTANNCPDITEIDGIVEDESGTTTTTTTYAGNDTIFWGSKLTGVMPDATEIQAGDSDIQNGSNDVTANFVAAGNQYHWIAIPNMTALHEKNVWFETVINTGNMGNPEDLFGAPSIVNILGQDYLVWITNYQTTFTLDTIFKYV